jgi:nucleoside-diphosphate-sugar epimerase
MRILVTGASGFVGRHAAAELVRMDAEVHVVTRNGASAFGICHHIDLLERDCAKLLLKAVRPDIVLHLAWCVAHGKFWTDPANLDWTGTTLALARAAADVGVRRFIGVGTCYEYDWPKTDDCKEFETPLARHTLYDTAKTSCRGLLEAYLEATSTAFVWARLFYLYGPGEDQRRLVANIARALAAGEDANCTLGTATRDYMHVRDAGAALAKTAVGTVRGVVNIGSGVGVRVAEIATILGQIARRPDLVHLGALPDRTDEPPRIVANVDRLRFEVGFQTKFDIVSGLGTTFEYWKRCATHAAN